MLAFGVYALKQATLTVGGTIGFKAHDCLVRVLTEIEGDGVISVNEVLTPDADGTPSAKRTFINETPLGTTSQNQSVVKSETNHDIPKIYFTDLTEDGNAAVITFTFTVNNDSFYPITASIQTEVDDTYVQNAIATASKEIAANGQDTLSVSYTLKKNANNDYDDLASLNYSIALDFGKVSSGNNQQQEPQQVVVSAPTNVSLGGDALSFTAVTGATSYEVAYFSGDNYVSGYEINTNEVTLTNKPETAGTYTVKVRTKVVDNNETTYSAYETAGSITVEAQQEPQQNEPVIDKYNLPQNFTEFNTLFANSNYQLQQVDYTQMTEQQLADAHAPENAVGYAMAQRDTQVYSYFFMDTEGHQEDYFNDILPTIAPMYNVIGNDGVTILCGVDGTQPYLDMTSIPQTRAGIVELFGSSSGYTDNITQNVGVGEQGWANPPFDGATATVVATKVHGMLYNITHRYGYYIFDNNEHMLAAVPTFEAGAQQMGGEVYYDESGVVLCMFQYEVSSNNNDPQPQEPETPKEYAGDAVITYYEAPNDDKMYTRSVTYYSDSGKTQKSRVVLETYDTDGATLLTTRTSTYVSYKDESNYKIEEVLESAENVKIQEVAFDCIDNIVNYKTISNYTNDSITSKYVYIYNGSYIPHDESQAIAGYETTYTAFLQENKDFNVTYFTTTLGALYNDENNIDVDQYYEYRSQTTTQVDLGDKNAEVVDTQTTICKESDDTTFRSKVVESYTYTVVNNNVEKTSTTTRHYDENDNVISKEVVAYDPYQNASGVTTTISNYEGESTLTKVSESAQNGMVRTTSDYTAGVISSQTIEDDINKTRTDKYYNDGVLVYYKVTTDKDVTWYNANDQEISDPTV